MWTKNIMLKKGEDGLYHIDAIIDLERCFYGDPKADFISSNTIVGDVCDSATFMENYSKISGRPFEFTQKDRVRMAMYFLYIIILLGAEAYRQVTEEGKQKVLEGRGILRRENRGRSGEAVICGRKRIPN